MLNLKDTDGILIYLNQTILLLFQVDGEDINLWLCMPLRIKIKE
jgi:hypothetical protein